MNNTKVNTGNPINYLAESGGVAQRDGKLDAKRLNTNLEVSDPMTFKAYVEGKLNLPIDGNQWHDRYDEYESNHFSDYLEAMSRISYTPVICQDY